MISFLVAVIILPALQIYASTMIVSFDYASDSSGNATSVINYAISTEAGWSHYGVEGTVYKTYTIHGDKFYYVAYAAIAVYDDYYGRKVLIGSGFGKVQIFHSGPSNGICDVRGYHLKSKEFVNDETPVIKYWDDPSKNYVEYNGHILKYTIKVDKEYCPDDTITVELSVYGFAAKTSYTGGPHSILPGLKSTNTNGHVSTSSFISNLNSDK